MFGDNKDEYAEFINKTDKYHTDVQLLAEQTIKELEQQAIDRAMELSDGNMNRAAELLGITRYALYRKLK
jgi:DNA-binding NtrC family response regulator